MPVVRWTSCNYLFFFEAQGETSIFFFFSKLLFVTVTVVNKVWKCFPLWSGFLLLAPLEWREHKGKLRCGSRKRLGCGDAHVRFLTYLTCWPFWGELIHFFFLITWLNESSLFFYVRGYQLWVHIGITKRALKKYANNLGPTPHELDFKKWGWIQSISIFWNHFNTQPWF